MIKPEKWTEIAANRLEEVLDQAESPRIAFRAVLWDIMAEQWARGVQFGGGVGTLKPDIGVNPYREPPFVLNLNDVERAAASAIKAGQTTVLLTPAEVMAMVDLSRARMEQANG